MHIGPLLNATHVQRDDLVPLDPGTASFEYVRILKTVHGYSEQAVGTVTARRTHKPRFDGKIRKPKTVRANSFIELCLDPEAAEASTWRDEDIVRACVAYAAAYGGDVHTITKTLASILQLQHGCVFDLNSIGAYVTLLPRDAPR